MLMVDTPQRAEHLDDDGEDPRLGAPLEAAARAIAALGPPLADADDAEELPAELRRLERAGWVPVRALLGVYRHRQQLFDELVAVDEAIRHEYPMDERDGGPAALAQRLVTDLHEARAVIARERDRRFQTVRAFKRVGSMVSELNQRLNAALGREHAERRRVRELEEQLADIRTRGGAA